MKDLFTSALMIAIMTLGLGILYPAAVWVAAQTFFPFRANGSLIQRNGVIVGSELLGQTFTGAGYFYSRPSAAGSGYDATASGGSNLGPTSQKLLGRIAADTETLQVENRLVMVPADLVTTSASGLDPNISPPAAEFQVPRIAAERQMTTDEVRALIGRFTTRRQLGFLGEESVNVLLLNSALDDERPLTK